MISSLTLADKDGTDVALMGTTGRECISISGLLGSGPVRDVRRVKPQRRGGIDESAYEDGSLVAAEFEATSTVSVAAAISTYRTMVAPMKQTLRHGAAWLKWREDTAGLQLQRKVKLASDVDPPLSNNAALVAWQAQFFCEDPRAFSQTQTTTTGAALSSSGGGKTYPFVYPRLYTATGGGTCSPVNAGTDDTPPIFRIYGYAVNPQIVNLTTQERIVLGSASSLATISSGDYLEIDVAARTLRLNGSTTGDRASFLDSAGSTWFELAPGTNYLQLIATDYDAGARLDVLARDAY